MLRSDIEACGHQELNKKANCSCLWVMPIVKLTIFNTFLPGIFNKFYFISYFVFVESQILCKYIFRYYFSSILGNS